nr:hypothetical protein [uncultured Anaeromusa sp.]
MLNLVRVLLLVNLLWIFYLLSDLKLYGMEQRWGTPFLYLFFLDSFPWKLYSAAIYPALVTIGAWWKWPKWRPFVRTALQIEAARYLVISLYFSFGLLMAHKSAAAKFVLIMAAAIGAAILLWTVQERLRRFEESREGKNLGNVVRGLLAIILAVTVIYVPILENKARLQHALDTPSAAMRVFKFQIDNIKDYAKDGRVALIRIYPDPHFAIYDLETRQYLNKIETAKPVTNAAFSPDGRYIVAAIQGSDKENTEDTGLELWDLETGIRVERFRKSPLMQERAKKKEYAWNSRYLEFSPDGKYLLAGREIWNFQTGQLLRVDEGVGWLDEQTYLNRNFTAVNMADLSVNKIGERDLFLDWKRRWAISQDGKRVGFYTFDQQRDEIEIEIWDLEKKEILLRLGKEIGKVRSMVFSLDGAWFVTGGEGGIKAWDIATGTLVKTIANGKAGEKMKFNAAGDKLLVFSTDIGACVIYKWD